MGLKIYRVILTLNLLLQTYLLASYPSILGLISVLVVICLCGYYIPLHKHK